MRIALAAVVVLVVSGCARGIVHSMEVADAEEVVAQTDAVDAAVPDAATSCGATKTDDACFDCCESKYPKAIDIWADAIDACCPDDECTDAAYEECELAADDLCAKDPECAGLEACEDTSGCWEKVSSAR